MAAYQVLTERSIRVEIRNPESHFPPLFVVRISQIDVQIDPFASRRDFEFPISLDILKIRSDENLRHVPIPELVSFSSGIRSGLQVERLERANEQKIEIILGPP